MGTITEYIKSGKNLADILNVMLEEDNKLAIQLAKTELSAGELEEKLDDIDRTYDFNKQKLKYINQIFNSEVVIQRKFLSVLRYIDSCDLSIYNQVMTILTLATLFNEFGINLAENYDRKDLYFLATTMVSIPLEKYKTYGYMISRNITKIRNKTSNEEYQRIICYEIFDYCDMFINDDMTKEEIDCYLNDVSTLINENRKSGKV